MRHLLASVAVLAVTVPLLAGPKFKSTWKAPEAATTSFAGKKVAALLITDDQNLQISGEEALVRELAAVGVTEGIATYRIVPREELKDPEKAKSWYEKAKVDGVVAMRLIKADTRSTWVPVWTSASYSTFWGYYPYGWNSLYVNDMGYTRREQVAQIETLVFSVPQNKLLWAGVTESTDPKDAASIIKDIVNGTVKEMTKQGLLKGRGGK